MALMFATLPLHANPGTDPLQVLKNASDTSTVIILKPSAEQERIIFEDSQLKYKRTVNTSPGLFERLLRVIASFLFENAGFDNVDRARQLVMWAVIIISVAVVIWLLARSDIARLTKSGTKKTAFNFNDLTEDLQSINYAQRIANALANNDYRLAIRWHYLEALYQLDKNAIIVFAPYKTNIDYRSEIKEKTMATLFSDLSRIYDYIWYGQFVIDETSYLKNAGQFENFKKQRHV